MLNDIQMSKYDLKWENHFNIEIRSANSSQLLLLLSV